MTPTSTPLSGKLGRHLRVVHLLVALGWLGGAYATLVLAVTAAAEPDAVTRSSVYRLIQLFDVAMMIPLATATVGGGLLLALNTQLLTRTWVIAKLALTVAILAGALLVRAGYVSDAAAGDVRATSRVITGSVLPLVAMVAAALLGWYRPGSRASAKRRVERDRSSSSSIERRRLR
jgi:uncharacterized membrane protein